MTKFSVGQRTKTASSDYSLRILYSMYNLYNTNCIVQFCCKPTQLHQDCYPLSSSCAVVTVVTTVIEALAETTPPTENLIKDRNCVFWCVVPSILAALHFGTYLDNMIWELNDPSVALAPLGSQS